MCELSIQFTIHRLPWHLSIYFSINSKISTWFWVFRFNPVSIPIHRFCQLKILLLSHVCNIFNSFQFGEIIQTKIWILLQQWIISLQCCVTTPIPFEPPARSNKTYHLHTAAKSKAFIGESNHWSIWNELANGPTLSSLLIVLYPALYQIHIIDAHFDSTCRNKQYFKQKCFKAKMSSNIGRKQIPATRFKLT